jgi:hypothetical protein
VTGSARLLRELENALQPASPLVGRGHWAVILDELRRGCDQNAQGAADPCWAVGTDSTVVRAHQHAAGARRSPPPHLATEPTVEVASNDKDGCR